GTGLRRRRCRLRGGRAARAAECAGLCVGRCRAVVHGGQDRRPPRVQPIACDRSESTQSARVSAIAREDAMKNIVVVCVVCAAASLFASQGQLGKAVVDRDRVDALRHYRVGQDALRNEHLDVAEKEFQTAARLDPTLELAPYGLGQVYMALKQYRPAIVAYEKCRDVIRANAVVVAGDEMVYQRRIDEQIK